MVILQRVGGDMAGLNGPSVHSIGVGVSHNDVMDSDGDDEIPSSPDSADYGEDGDLIGAHMTPDDVSAQLAAAGKVNSRTHQQVMDFDENLVTQSVWVIILKLKKK